MSAALPTAMVGKWIKSMVGGAGELGGWFARSPRPEGAHIYQFGTCPVPERPDTLRVMTWNIHYACGPSLEVGRFASRNQVVDWLEGIAATLRDAEVDVAALQEVDRGALRTHDIDQLAWLAEAAGLSHVAWTETWRVPWVPHPGLQPSRQIGRVLSGQAVLSRYPLARAERTPLPQPTTTGRLYNRFYLHRAVLGVDVEPSGHSSVRVLNAHLEAFDNDNRRSHAQVVQEMMRQGSPRTLLLGDLNSVPPEAAQRHGFADEPWTDMRQDDILAGLRAVPGCVELVSEQDYKEQEQAWFTFPASAPNRRLDYGFVREGLKATDARVVLPEVLSSDHLPVVATLLL